MSSKCEKPVNKSSPYKSRNLKDIIRARSTNLKATIRERSLIIQALEDEKISEQAKKFVDNISENLAILHAQGDHEIAKYVVESDKIGLKVIEILGAEGIYAELYFTESLGCDLSPSREYKVHVTLSSIDEI